MTLRAISFFRKNHSFTYRTKFVNPLFTTVLLCMFLAGFSIPVHASNKDLTMCITGQFPPFYYKEGDSYKGASFEIVSRVLTKLGYSVTNIESYPMKRLLRYLKSGDCDISPNLSPTPNRLRIAAFTNVPHLIETHDLLVRANSKITYSGDLKEISQYDFGAMAGWTHGPDFDNANYLNKQYRYSVEAQIKSLIRKRFDIAINNRDYFLYYARKLGLENKIKSLEPTTYRLPVTVALSLRREHVELEIAALDKEIRRFKQTDDYQSILQKYNFHFSYPNMAYLMYIK